MDDTDPQDASTTYVRWQESDGGWSPWLGCVGAEVHDGVLDIHIDADGRVLVPLHAIPGPIEVETVQPPEHPDPEPLRITDVYRPLRLRDLQGSTA